MKILVIESEDAGLDFVLRCVAAGHQVRYWLSPNASQHIGQGFKGVEFVKNWTQSAKWADLVFPTGNDNYINRLEYFRRAGVAVFAPSVQSAKLETDSDFGMEFLENHWIECPERKTFETLADAEAFARKSSERWVVRTEDKSYCAKSPADLVALLQRWQRTGMNGQCMLQKFIVGSGLKVGGWMGKEGFSGLPNEQLGRLAGGAVVKYCTRSDLFEMVLKPLEDALVSLEHFGHITVNCIIDEDGKAWPLGFAARPSWPAFNLMAATTKSDPAEWMRDACEGKDSLEVSTAIAVGVVVAQSKEVNIPIYGVTAKNRKFIAPQSVKMATLPDMEGEELVERNMWATAGDHSCVVHGTGRSIAQAAERAYKTVQQLHIPDMIYRDHIGEDNELPKLHEHGFALEFEYQ